jgi:hypothetical protein
MYVCFSIRIKWHRIISHTLVVSHVIDYVIACSLKSVEDKFAETILHLIS